MKTPFFLFFVFFCPLCCGLEFRARTAAGREQWGGSVNARDGVGEKERRVYPRAREEEMKGAPSAGKSKTSEMLGN